ncbi:hypothetical protein ETAA1_01680 [Urbifossiella limnaea]|uniref:Uncharacterized protein n=1 Tax=Urbifossiella limnaea TaxID=2528023 RepID=A0A517XL98_9BACT|nr:hypothetical protein ETAA1_01680 [Urbifossiella limnaea]
MDQRRPVLGLILMVVGFGAATFGVSLAGRGIVFIGCGGVCAGVALGTYGFWVALYNPNPPGPPEWEEDW